MDCAFDSLTICVCLKEREGERVRGNKFIYFESAQLSAKRESLNFYHCQWICARYLGSTCLLRLIGKRTNPGLGCRDVTPLISFKNRSHLDKRLLLHIGRQACRAVL